MDNEKNLEQNDHQTDVHLSVVPHPFSVERIDHYIPEGACLADILSEVQPDPLLLRCVHVFINDDHIPQEKWHVIKPKAGTTVQLRAVPMGGGGGSKNPLKTVLSLAVLASTAFIGGAVAGTAFGQASFLGITGSRLISGALSFVGRLALNAIAPPPRQKSSSTIRENPTLFIQGARNQIEPFGKIPQVLGQHRMVPPMAAKPFTETIGNDQYLRMLFVWGYGPLDISDLKIGETPLDEFSDVEIEHRHGYETDTPMSLYSASVLQNDLQVTLKQADGYHTRTTERDADEISVDITFPRGLFFLKTDGNRTTRQVDVEVQYAPTGTTDWSVGSGSYTNIAQQNSAAFTAPGMKDMQAGEHGYAGRYYKRIDRVVLDRASGEISVLTGERKGGFDAAGVATEFALGEPVAPLIPETHYAIAYVEHVGDSLFTAWQDERNLDLVPSVFEDENDFAPSLLTDKVQVASGGLTFLAFHVVAKQSNALRKSIRISVPQGQYDVRVKRITNDSNDDSVFDEVLWTALRTTHHESPVNMSGLAMTALRIKATDQLNGTLDRFNGVVQSIVKDWNGSAWVEQPTSNPASLFRHVLQGTANARPLPDTRLDLSKLETWHSLCAQNGREFNGAVDYQASVRDVLLDVAAAGRASPSVIDGKWAVVTDQIQTAPVQHFTPRNSFDFYGERQFDNFPHALRIRFANRHAGWQQDEMLVFDDGYDDNNATEFETLELPGITDPNQIWKDGRYHIASARLRPETYSFKTDIEYIVCTRGDLIRFTHDVPLFGIQAARVKSVQTSAGDVVSVTLDEEITMQTGKTYSVRYRKADGTSSVENIVNTEDTGNTIVFVTPVVSANATETGDLLMFGENGQESVELIVQSIHPGPDLTARITCVDAAPALHNVDTGTIPDFNSQMTIPEDMLPPPQPVILQVQSGTDVMVQDSSGFSPRIVIHLERVATMSRLDIGVQIKSVVETSYSYAEFTRLSDDMIAISNVTTGELYDIRLFYLRENSWASLVTLLPNYQVEGTGGVPADITEFSVNILGDTAHLSWAPVLNIDLSHYNLRFASQTSAVTWEEAIDLLPAISAGTNAVSVPASIGTYFLKAVDLQGQESENAVQIVSTIAGLSGHNVVEEIDEAASFSGDVQDMVVSDNVLQLAGIDHVEDWTNIDLASDFDIGENGLAVSGVYDFADVFDLGAVYTSTLSAYLNVFGLDISNTVDQWDNVDWNGDWDGTIAGQYWNISLQLRTTDDDPLNPLAVWGNWQNFILGDYTARGFDFRVLATTADPNVTPCISALKITIDMPDRVIGAEDIVSNISGSSIVFDSAFRATPAIAVSAQDMQTEDYYTITNTSENGFDICFYNSVGTGVVRKFDYVAKGHGIKAS